MHNEQTLRLLQEVASGSVTPEDALLSLRMEPFEELGYAKVDLHRSLRQGRAEVIYGAGKTPEQIVGIVRVLHEAGNDNILITRLSADAAASVASQVELCYHADAKIGVAYPKPVKGVGNVVIATGGTSDIPVAEEAAITAETLGSRVTRLYDVGVSGIHRLLANTDKLMNARVIIAVAGMEGALASVVGGLTDCPLIAVPTSIGYGASFGGVAALLAMLNSCASGSCVVNIDNGFGAGFLANRINRMESPADEQGAEE
ncbi:MAG: nickel pincer cofactor biosynthesis protein LarB [Ruminococcaceae bacterium]|nr:nickel pincer cofactor biosynthesis protein LarB [Oscillospiraceae bacterium]